MEQDAGQRAEQGIEESLRIARREHQLAVERQDDTSAGMLERAIVDLEHRDPGPPQRDGLRSQSDEVS